MAEGSELSTWEPVPYRAPGWARNPHVQTLAGKLLRPAATVRLRRERWRTPDGDFLDLDFGTHPPESGKPPTPERQHPSPEVRPEARPLVLVLHGLEGSSERSYVALALREIHARGMSGVALNFRGCSGEANRTPRAYHSGETGDLAFVLERLRARRPRRPLRALGFSLGGNVLLKHLAERGSRALLSGAAAISVPFDLEAGARQLEAVPMGWLYTRYFLRSLAGKLRAKRELLTGRIDLDRALKSRTLREFDDRVTAPLHGFRDAAHYYRASSSGPLLGRIGVPTLLLQARDDPFLPSDAIPEAASRENPFIRLVLTARGGHVGFLEGSPWAPGFWAERTAAGFLAAFQDPRPDTPEP